MRTVCPMTRRLLLRSSKHPFDVGEEAVDLTGVELRRATMSEADGSVNKRGRSPAASCPSRALKFRT